MKRTYALGERAESTRVVTAEDVDEYIALTGDASPAYTREVPPGLLGGMFSDLLGTKLPGRGTNWLKQKLEFPLPALIGEPLTATVEIVRIRTDKDLINLSTTCAAQDGRIVCRGEALVLAREMEA